MARKTDSKADHEDFVRRPLREQLMDLLSMHSVERRGAAFLVILLCGLSAWVVYEQWIRKPAVEDLSALEAGMEKWVVERERSDAPVAVSEPFPFDPNTIDREGWVRLGLSERQINGIQNYKAKGGRFRSKKDLARMYTLRPEDYQRLAPFILLPDSVERRAYVHRPHLERDTARPNWASARPKTGEERAFSLVEVNTADTNMLIALPGIGPAFARGIVKYRESLGGYRSLDQLAEVYVLKDKPDAVARLKELLVLDTSMVRTIAINTCTVEELAAHPYARWTIAKPLVAYRNQHGPFGQVADIRRCALVTEEVFRKLAPYLSVE